MENIDFVIVITFLITILLLGIGHRRKIKCLNDFALSKRDFSTSTLVATIVATYASGSGFFIELNHTYNKGLFFVIATLFIGIQMLIIAYVLVPRMGEFLGNMSVAETMGKLYGKEVRFITALAGLIGTIGAAAVQFKVFSGLISYFIGIPQIISVMLAGFIVTIYPALGGIRAMTITHILLFSTFTLTIPLAGVIIWDKIYLIQQYTEGIFELPNFQFSELFNPSNVNFWLMVSLILYFMIPSMFPAIYQKILIGKNLAQIKKSFIISAFLLTATLLSVCWIALLVLKVSNHLHSDQTLSYILENYAYTGVKGLLIIGVMAMAVSTADSNINISSILFVNDICASLKFTSSVQIIMAKCFTFILGATAVILSLIEQDPLSIILAANSFYMPIVTVPLITSILGFRSTKISVLISMVAGFFTVIIWKIFAIRTDPIFFAMIVNLVFLIASHYIFKQEGGFVGIKNKKSFYELINAKVDAKNIRAEKIHNFSFIKYCQEKSPVDNLSYIGLGIYFIIFTISTIYSTKDILSENIITVVIIYHLMIITGILVATYPIWPLPTKKSSKEKIGQVMWFLAIFYMLIVFNFLFLIINNFGPLQFSIFSITLLIVFILMGYGLASIMHIAGVVIASIIYFFFSYYRADFGIVSFSIICIYLLTFTATILVTFVKPKNNCQPVNINIKNTSKIIHFEKENFTKLNNASQAILDNFDYILRIPLTSVINFAEILSAQLTNYNSKELKTLLADMLKNSTRISANVLTIIDLAMINYKKLILQKRIVNLSEIVEDRSIKCFKLYNRNKNLKLKLNVVSEILMKVDPNYLKQAIDNLLINAINYSKSEVIINLTLSKNNNHVRFNISNDEPHIFKKELEQLFQSPRINTKDFNFLQHTAGLALCKIVIEAHGGKIIAETNNKLVTNIMFMLAI